MILVSMESKRRGVVAEALSRKMAKIGFSFKDEKQFKHLVYTSSRFNKSQTFFACHGLDILALIEAHISVIGYMNCLLSL